MARPSPVRVPPGSPSGKAYASTPSNAHRWFSRRFLAADVPRQPTGQAGPVRFHDVAQRLRRNPRLYSQHRGGLHVFTHTKSATDVPPLRRVRWYCRCRVEDRGDLLRDFRETLNRRSRTLKYVRVHRIEII